MINITKKENCCGCKACGDICNKKAITFHTDQEGVWYPKVDEAKCVDCGLCEKVCPILHPDFSELGNSSNPTTYILQAPEAEDRLASASGAAYTLLATAVIKQGGYVAGHIWNGKSDVKGYISSTPEDLNILRGTKYLQSDTEGLFTATREALKTGKLVLFSGCPCQVAAIKRFLRKDYENLITADFTCMGIDSPLAFAKYHESLEREYGAEIVYFKAKAKEVGWKHLTNKAIFANGRTHFGINGDDANLKATFLNVLVRPSCYDCKFKGFPRTADMTIGDYWRKNQDYDPLDDNTGTSYIILNNKKAEQIFELCKPYCNYRQTTHTHILGANPMAAKSLGHPTFSRDEFYERIQHEDFKAVVDYYYNRKHKKNKPHYKSGLKLLVKIAYYNRYNPISFLRFLHYNFFSKQVKTDFWRGDMLIVRDAKLSLSKGSQIIVKGVNVVDCNGCNGFITISNGSKLSLNQNIFNGTISIDLQSGASLTIDKYTEFGKNVYIRLKRDALIRDFTLISDNVTIDDTNAGVVLFDEHTEPETNILIGTHVLVGRGAIIKKGTELLDETIVKENSVVEGKHNRGIVLSGNPAKTIDNNINWKYNFKTKWNFKN
ncbi:MAG: Coenzyme F420 hydrogenase/dehydrogenase, beta subunit C-terminal domain [Bacteroidaceae bacterium]|nr:Coenzyme F420 hydrogenase/dehydrogenase, beta subunit C-terminal domain [Bacteroidaceae bacterium]